MTNILLALLIFAIFDAIANLVSPYVPDKEYEKNYISTEEDK